MASTGQAVIFTYVRIEATQLIMANIICSTHPVKVYWPGSSLLKSEVVFSLTSNWIKVTGCILCASIAMRVGVICNILSGMYDLCGLTALWWFTYLELPRYLPQRYCLRVSQIHCGDYYSLNHIIDLITIPCLGFARWLYGCSRTRLWCPFRSLDQMPSCVFAFRPCLGPLWHSTATPVAVECKTPPSIAPYLHCLIDGTLYCTYSGVNPEFD